MNGSTLNIHSVSVWIYYTIYLGYERVYPDHPLRVCVAVRELHLPAQQHEARLGHCHHPGGEQVGGFGATGEI